MINRCCLPIQSKALLPKSYQDIMVEFSDCFPVTFEEEANYKLASFESVVLIPSLPLDEIKKYIEKAKPNDRLTEKERKRSENSSTELIFSYDKLQNNVVIKKILNILPKKDAKLVNIMSNRTDRTYKGCPTLQPFQDTLFDYFYINIFGHPSQKQSVALILCEMSENLVKQKHKEYLTAPYYYGYPSFIPCFVQSILTKNFVYSYEDLILSDDGLLPSKIFAKIVETRQKDVIGFTQEQNKLSSKYLKGDKNVLGYGGIDLSGNIAIAAIYPFKQWILKENNYIMKYETSPIFVPLETLRLSKTVPIENPMKYLSIEMKGTAFINVPIQFESVNLYGQKIEIISELEDSSMVTVEYRCSLYQEPKFSHNIEASLPSVGKKLSLICKDNSWKVDTILSKYE